MGSWDRFAPQIPTGFAVRFGSQNHAMWVPVTLPIHMGGAATFECEGFDLTQLMFMQVRVAVWPL